MCKLPALICWLFVLAMVAESATAADPQFRQITFGPRHHFFGYIGHVKTIPWNSSGRFIVALQTAFQDRMPTSHDAADIVLLDAHDNYALRVIDRTCAWNFQNGTMLYWNPQAAETQFFFNDRDPATNEIFTVLYDVSVKDRPRVREYRFPGMPIANSGMSPVGGAFAAYNYGRLAWLRPVTGYPEAADWNNKVMHPSDDGVFVVETGSGVKRLLASYRQLADAIRPTRPDVDDMYLFLNYTLWSPDARHIFFYCRGNWEGYKRGKTLDVPFLVNTETGALTLLRRQDFPGHPEWLDGGRILSPWGKRLGIFDLEQRKHVGAFGDEQTFPNPGGDTALSLDGRWLVNGSNGSGKVNENHYTFYRIADGLTFNSHPLQRGRWTGGSLRIDGAPCWNRSGTAVVATGVADDAEHTRQMFLLDIDKDLDRKPAMK